MNTKLNVCAALMVACGLGHVHAAQVAPAAVKVTGMTFTATALPGYPGQASAVLDDPGTQLPDQIAVSERGTTPLGQEWKRFTEYTTIDSDVSVTLPSGQATIARQGVNIEAFSHLDTNYIGLRSGRDGAVASTYLPVLYDFTLSPRSSLSVSAQFSFLVPSVETMGFDQLPADIQALASAPNGFVELQSRASVSLDLTAYPATYEDNISPYSVTKSLTASGTGRLTGDALTFTPYTNFNGFYADDGDVSTTLTPTADGMYNLTAEVTMTINNYRNNAVRVILRESMGASSYFEASGTVPEPSTWAFMGLGLVGVAVVAKRRHKAALQAA